MHQNIGPKIWTQFQLQKNYAPKKQIQIEFFTGQVEARLEAPNQHEASKKSLKAFIYHPKVYALPLGQ